ncbi:hypothetical protein H6G76_30975 [Nostoc sp. FACHB-152]|nr:MULTISPECIES: hypothetical protein [unclassified Nostoc]MBD2451469.1 hypothetical protein [Nostoc sp. FACHB-152]MBD2472510.1 hypothetical protein [Nostoc sp. FACHB-145]
MRTDAADLRSPCANIFRFSGRDSEKSVAVVGEAQAFLSYCCGGETVEFD